MFKKSPLPSAGMPWPKVRGDFQVGDDVIYLVDPSSLRIRSSTFVRCALLEKAMQRYTKEVQRFGDYAQVGS